MLSNEADSVWWHTARPVETDLWLWWAAAAQSVALLERCCLLGLSVFRFQSRQTFRNSKMSL